MQSLAVVDDDTWVSQVRKRHGFDDEDGGGDDAFFGGDEYRSHTFVRSFRSSERKISAKNETFNMASRLTVCFKELMQELIHQSTTSLTADDSIEFQTSIPRTLYLRYSRDDSETASLLELTYNHLEISIDQLLFAMKEMKKELDLLLTMDETSEASEKTIELLHSILRLSPTFELLLLRVLKPLLDERWMLLETVGSDHCVLCHCRVALAVQIIESFFRQYSVSISKVRTKLRKGDNFANAIGKFWDIRAETISVTLFELLQHSLLELFAILDGSFGDNKQRNGANSLEYQPSNYFQRLLKQSGHTEALRVLLKCYERDSMGVSDAGTESNSPSHALTEHGNIFREVCCDILLSMGRVCPVDSQTILSICSKNLCAWREVLEGHNQKPSSYKRSWIAEFNDGLDVPSFNQSKSLAPIPNEALDILSKINGPLILRHETVGRILRRILTPYIKQRLVPKNNQLQANDISTNLSGTNAEFNHKRERTIAVVSPLELISKGSGKSTVAALIAQCPEVRTFYDHIILLSLKEIRGNDLTYSQFKSLLEEATNQMKCSNTTTLEQIFDCRDFVPYVDVSSKNFLGSLEQRWSSRQQEVGFMTYIQSRFFGLLQTKNVLFLLDDVADNAVLQWFRSPPKEQDRATLESTSNSLQHNPTGTFSVVATTDNRELLPAADMVELEPLSVDDAMKLISSKSWYSSGIDTKQLKDIIQACHFQPMALSLFGRPLDILDPTDDQQEDKRDLLMKLFEELQSQEESGGDFDPSLVVSNALIESIACKDPCSFELSSKYLKLCFVGFVKVLCEDLMSTTRTCLPVLPKDVVSCLFDCLVKVVVKDCQNKSKYQTYHESEGETILTKLVDIGLLKLVSDAPFGGLQINDRVGIRLMHSSYVNHASKIAQTDPLLSPLLESSYVRRWNASFGSYLFLSLVKSDFDGTKNADIDLSQIYKRWEAPLQRSPLLEYALQKLPMHLLRGGLYEQAMDLLGSSSFVCDRVHYFDTAQETKAIATQHISNITFLTKMLPSHYDRKSILKRLYLPYGNQLMQVLEDYSNMLTNDVKGEEKKVEEPECTHKGELKNNEKIKEIAFAFLNFGISLAEGHCYECAVKFWKTSCDNLTAYHGTHLVETIASIYQMMGITYRDLLHDNDKGIECLTDCLAIRRELHGDKHILTAQTLRSLSDCFVGIGAFEDAKTGLTLALNMLQHKPRLHRDEVAEIQESIGNLHFQFSRYGLALECYQNVILNRAAEYGEESELLASIYERIGRCQVKLGSMDSAATSITRAQELLNSMDTTGEVKNTYSNEHSATLSALRGLLYDINDQPEESLVCYQNAVELYQEQLRHDGETSRSIYLKDQLALLLHDSGCICLKLSNHSKALRCFEASLKERRIESSSRMPYRLGCILDAAETLYSMSKAYEKQGQLEKALRCLGESLKIRDQYTPDSEVLAVTHLQIASVACEKRDSTKAQVALQTALDIRRKLHNGDENNESVVTIRNALCNLNKEIR